MYLPIPALILSFMKSGVVGFFFKGIQFVVCYVWQRDVVPGDRQPLKSLKLVEILMHFS